MKYKLSELALKGNKQVDDILATLELLNEKYHSNITVTFSRARRGHANNKRIIMPIHTIDNTFSNEYGIYYLIHEFTHTFGIFDHGKKFKKLERELLQLFGLQIEYKKAYPSKLIAYGNTVYESK